LRTAAGRNVNAPKNRPLTPYIYGHQKISSELRDDGSLVIDMPDFFVFATVTVPLAPLFPQHQ